MEAKDNAGKPALRLAAEKGRDEVMKLLLERGADVDARGWYGRTALHGASYKGVLEAVRLLLEHGADVEAKDIYGQIPLQSAAAAEGEYHEVVKLLREHGAK